METDGNWWNMLEWYCGHWIIVNIKEYDGIWEACSRLEVEKALVKVYVLFWLRCDHLYLYIYVKYLYIYIFTYLCMSFVSSLCTHERCFYSPSVSRWLFDSRIRLWVEVIAAKEFWRTDGLGWQDHAMARNTSYKYQETPFMECIIPSLTTYIHL